MADVLKSTVDLANLKPEVIDAIKTLRPEVIDAIRSSSCQSCQACQACQSCQAALTEQPDVVTALN